jgi:hypothetical protein
MVYYRVVRHTEDERGVVVAITLKFIGVAFAKSRPSFRCSVVSPHVV